MSRQIPDFYFEQMLLDELPEDKREMVTSSPNYERKMKELKESTQSILRAYPPEEFAKRLSQREQADTPEKKIIRFPLKVMVPIAAAACFALVILTFPSLITNRSTAESTTEEMTRVKGLKPTLKIYRENNGDTELLSDHALISEHDLLQLSYNAGGKKYGTILSIDGRGTITLHHPAFESLSPLLSNEGEVALPYAYELDDAPTFEQFFLITSEKDFDVTEFINIVREQTQDVRPGEVITLDIPESYEQTSVYLKKGNTHEKN